MKLSDLRKIEAEFGRPPRGGRGLKSLAAPEPVDICQSPPSRGAWIEMLIIQLVIVTVWSPPSRGAWIEIHLRLLCDTITVVAPLAGGVD